MNKKGVFPILAVIAAVAGILVFIALAAVGIGFFDFLKSNWIWILLITLAYLALFKMKLLKKVFT